MKPRFIQVNCIEGRKLDLRQSRAVLRYRPDIIFLEYPAAALKPIKKPARISKAVIKKNPWTASDNHMWDNIARLWQEKPAAMVYAVDGPEDLVTKANIYPFNEKNPGRTYDLFWWTRIYLRECFMARRIDKILKSYNQKNNPVVLAFLQRFHWRHVQFLLAKPAKNKIWDFYFGRFKDLNKRDMPGILRDKNKILLKYWNSPANLL